MVADGTAEPGRVAGDLLAQAEHGPDSEALLVTNDRGLASSVESLVGGQENISVQLGRDARRRDRVVGVVRARAPGAPRRRSRCGSLAGAERRFGVRRVLVRRRRLCGRGNARAADRWACPIDGRARDRGVSQASPDRHGDERGRAARGGGRRPAGAGRGATAPRGGGDGMSVAREKAQPVGDGFAPYVWSAGVAEVAERHGVPREAVLKFDQNTPPLPGVPQVPLAESMARLNEYPDGTYRELREAAAGYVGLVPENVVVGAGADDLILLLALTFLGPGRRAAIDPPTYALYRIATTLHGADVVGVGETADLRWVCNPNNPTGAWVEPEQIVSLARAEPETIVVVDEAYVEYGARSCAPWVDELPNLVVLRTLSKAFGLAGLRVGFALAHPDTAALLTERRAPAPIAGPAAAIGAAALRSPRLGDVESTDRRARAAPHGARRGRLRVRADGDELRLRPDGSGARRAARGARAGGAHVRGGDPRHGPPSLRERRAAPCPRRGAGAARRTTGDGAANDDRDRPPADARPRRNGQDSRGDGDRLSRPSPDASRLPWRPRPRPRRRR